MDKEDFFGRVAASELAPEARLYWVVLIAMVAIITAKSLGI